MNANAIDVSEPRMVGMEDDVAIAVPVSIAWSQQQLNGDSKCCSAGNPVTFLHKSTRITRIDIDPRYPCCLWLIFLTRQQRPYISQQFVRTNRTVSMLLNK